MINLRQFLLTAAAAPLLFTAQASAADNVVASIKPVHSLVSAVMEGVGTPELLVKGAASPHAYSMRPSEATMLEEADLVFWVGPDLEVFLDDPLHTLASDADVVALSETPGLTLLEMREGGAFEAHDHGRDEHDHAQHEHKHEHEHHAHDEHDHDDHAHGETDTHLWLDPENARKMVQRIADELSKADPDNAAVYAENAAALDARLESLIAETNDALAGVREKPFVVFHDAYHYYENRFGIAAAGSITVSPDVLPGARRVSEIHGRIAELNAACVFSEPQFEPKLISVVTEGTEARSGVLDPLGADIEDGPELYFTLIDNLTASLVECLSSES